MAKDTLQRAKGVMKQVKHKMTSGGNSEQVYKKLLTVKTLFSISWTTSDGVLIICRWLKKFVLMAMAW